MVSILTAMLLSGGFTPGTSSGGGYSTIQDEGAPLTQRATVNFTGAGVSCTDSGGITVCTITGGGGGGSANVVETSIAMTGAGVYSTAVTGQAWVSTSSKIICSTFGTITDGLTPEAVAVAGLTVSWSTPVAGTGFTVWLSNPNGLTGTVRLHCTGA